jgi:hypothetical protein
MQSGGKRKGEKDMGAIKWGDMGGVARLPGGGATGKGLAPLEGPWRGFAPAAMPPRRPLHSSTK